MSGKRCKWIRRSLEYGIGRRPPKSRWSADGTVVIELSMWRQAKIAWKRYRAR